MKRGADGFWRTVGGIKVNAQQQAELDRKNVDERVRSAILSFCDGTFPGATPNLPELTGIELEAFIVHVQEAARGFK